MKDMKLSNIQKESEKMKLKKSINDYEDLKAQKLLKLGIKTFDKIRKGEIIDGDFDNLCEDIKKFDIEIYKKYMQLRKFESENKRTTCECGYVAFKNEKFCPQCGKNLIEEEVSYITCQNCHEETEIDSNFCACCGSKIVSEFKYYDDEVYCENTLFNMENYESEEVPEIDMVEEEFGKEFLKKQEELAIEENFIEDVEINNDDIEEDSIIMEGRKFLKTHQESSEEDNQE